MTPYQFAFMRKRDLYLGMLFALLVAASLHLIGALGLYLAGLPAAATTAIGLGVIEGVASLMLLRKKRAVSRRLEASIAEAGNPQDFFLRPRALDDEAEYEDDDEYERRA